MAPREFFPKMPDSVFDMWLAPFIDEIGWPFQSMHDSTDGTQWNRLMGSDKTIADWASCEWALINIDFTNIKVSVYSQYALHAIINFCTKGIPTKTANLPNTKERFRACADYIRANNTIPLPIVAVINGREFDIIDGNHRIAALAHVGAPKGYKIPAWVPQFK